MPHDTKEENTDYSTPHEIFLRESKGANYITKDTRYRDMMRRYKNPQVLTVQNYTVLGYGLRLSDSELITHFPLPESFIIDTFIREVMCVVQEFCPVESENKDDKPKESEMDRRITAIHEARVLKKLSDWTEEDRISDEELRYRYIHGRILGAIFCSAYPVTAATHTLFLDKTTLDAVDELSDVIAYSLSKDHTQFSFSHLVKAIVEIRKKTGMKKTKLENYLVEKEGYTHLRSVENEVQESCGLVVVDKIASSLRTTSRQIYRKAEEIADSEIKVSVSPLDKCKNQQDACKIQQDNTRIQQDENKIQQDVKTDKASIPAVILEFCFIPRSLTEIKNRLGYSDRNTVMKFINELLASGDLSRKIPDKPTSRYQKYTSVRKKKG